MRLRLVAHYYDVSEALVARSALDAEGVACFLHGADILAVQPDRMFGFHGLRLFVPEQELTTAIAILREARAGPLTEGGHLTVQRLFVLGLILTLVIGVPVPVWFHIWSDDQNG